MVAGPELLRYEDLGAESPPERLVGALALSTGVGWAAGLEAWRLLISISKGCIALDAQGQATASIVATPHGWTGAALSIFIVHEASRGNGIGRALLQGVLEGEVDAEARETRLVASADSGRTRCMPNMASSRPAPFAGTSSPSRS